MAPSAKEVNIAVVVRCRPLSEREGPQHAEPVRVRPATGVVEVQQPGKAQARTFAFDRVFGPAAGQAEFYSAALSPTIADFLAGYNCTVFAYGQTGTGKTYTMSGEELTAGVDGAALDLAAVPAAGVIPRAVDEIFRSLDERDADYQMRVTHMEVYNEEIYDLLQDSREPLKVYEERGPAPGAQGSARESSGPGFGGKIVVAGLEEVLVKSPAEVLRLLVRSSENRRVAETRMNSSSSRSHSIFTISLLTKEVQATMNAAEATEVEMIKISKLNLVDLAGSESLGKSGAAGERQQEASKINRSLLTLGRVINSLTELRSHVPYRESKLTRLLQDSLGGRTQTCIIATITPSAGSLEETLSTLDYMTRAKRIKNAPEISAKVNSRTILREYSVELKHLREMLSLQRQQHGGVFVPAEEYDGLGAQLREGRARIDELEALIARQEVEVRTIQSLLAQESRRVLKLKQALARTADRVSEIHREKVRLHDKLVAGRGRDASNASRVAQFRETLLGPALAALFQASSLAAWRQRSDVDAALASLDVSLDAVRDIAEACEGAVDSQLRAGASSLRSDLEQLCRDVVDAHLAPVAATLAGSLHPAVSGLDPGALAATVASAVSVFLSDKLEPAVSSLSSRLRAPLQEARTIAAGLRSSSARACAEAQRFCTEAEAAVRAMAARASALLDAQVAEAAASAERQRDGHSRRLREAVLGAVASVLDGEDGQSASELRALAEADSDRARASKAELGTAAESLSSRLNSHSSTDVVAAKASVEAAAGALEEAAGRADLVLTTGAGAIRDRCSDLRVSVLPGALESGVIGPLASLRGSLLGSLSEAETRLGRLQAFLGPAADAIAGRAAAGMADCRAGVQTALGPIRSDLLSRTDGGRTVLCANLDSAVSSLLSEVRAATQDALQAALRGLQLSPVLPPGSGALATPSLATPVVRQVPLSESGAGGWSVYAVATPNPADRSASLAVDSDLSGMSAPPGKMGVAAGPGVAPLDGGAILLGVCTSPGPDQARKTATPSAAQRRPASSLSRNASTPSAAAVRRPASRRL